MIKRIEIKIQDDDPLYLFMVQRAADYNMGVSNYAELVNRAVYRLSIGDASLMSMLGCQQALAALPAAPPAPPPAVDESAIDDALDRML